MNNKGFTLVEVIVVIAIISIASALIGTQFFSILGKGGKADKFEDEVLAKSLAEAAYVFYDSKKNTNNDSCITAEMLLNNDYITADQGLLTKYTDEEIKKFAVYVRYVDSEKITTVYKSNNNICGSSYNCCNTSNATEIKY